MKAASLKEIKSELAGLDTNSLVDYCLRLAKFKKENKELLTYLLFESADETGYLNGLKEEIEEQFKSVSKGHVFFVKKTLRKILRYVNRFSRYSGNEVTEIELRIHYCQLMIKNQVSIQKGNVIYNLYFQQLKKIKSLISKLSEDLQYDYESDVKALERKL